MHKQKILVILGPTATGKSDLAVSVAKKYNGEIISADSRQVYKGLDIGTGKITETEMQGVPHHLIDVAEPYERFSVVKWKEMAELSISEIEKRGKLPIVCGGTGYYIQALIDNTAFTEVESDPDEQKKLEKLSAEELIKEIEKVDPERAAIIKASPSESKNVRRLARSLIIVRALSVQPVEVKVSNSTAKEDKYDILQIGLAVSSEEMHERIKYRLLKRLDIGMIDEAMKLHKEGLGFYRMNELGLEYKYLAELLQNKISKKDFIEVLATKIWQYSRRQMTWFKRDNRISWFEPSETEKIDTKIATWLASRS